MGPLICRCRWSPYCTVYIYIFEQIGGLYFAPLDRPRVLMVLIPEYNIVNGLGGLFQVLDLENA